MTISTTNEVLQGCGAGDDYHEDHLHDNQEPHHQQQGHVQHAGVEGTLEEDTEGSRGGEKMASFHDDLLQQDGVQGSLPAHPSTVSAHEGNHKGTHLIHLQGLGPHTVMRVVPAPDPPAQLEQHAGTHTPKLQMAVVTTTHQELQVQVSTSKGNDTAVNLPLGHLATGGLPAQAAEPVSTAKEAGKKVTYTKFTESRGCVSTSPWKGSVKKASVE